MSTANLPMPPEALALLAAKVWKGGQWHGQQLAGCATGFPALDAQLPGGGWPTHAMCELILNRAGQGEWRLLAPALSRPELSQRGVLLVNPPAGLCWPGLCACGLQPASWVTVHPASKAGGRAMSEALWSTEQALRCGQLGAVLSWLPAAVRPEHLRRLQLAADAHPGLFWVLRPLSARTHTSPAPLRLWLGAAAPDVLALEVLKRRGPPLAQRLHLALSPRVLPHVVCPTDAPAWPAQGDVRQAALQTASHSLL